MTGGRLWVVVVVAALGLAGSVALLGRRYRAKPAAPDERAQLQQAFARAAEHRRPVVLVFWQRDCPGCERLEKEVLERGYVKQALADYEVARLEGVLHPELVEEYKIWAYPTVLFVSAHGKSWYRIEGTPRGRADELFVRQLRGVSKIAKLLPDPAKPPDEPDTALEAGRLYMDLGDFHRAAQLLARARKLKGREEALKDESLCALEPLAVARAGEPEKALEGLRAYLGRYPAGRHREEVSLELGLALAELRRNEEAAEQLRVFLQEFPASDRAEEAREALAEVRQRLEGAGEPSAYHCNGRYETASSPASPHGWPRCS